MLRRRGVGDPCCPRRGTRGACARHRCGGAAAELARARAADEGLANIEFRSGDATRTGLPDGGFDAVVCVFGVFFAADMTAFLRDIWRLVRPGGVVAVTTLGPGLFEPANSHFWRCVGEVEPALVKAFHPWDEITTPAALAGLFAGAGAGTRQSRVHAA